MALQLEATWTVISTDPSTVAARILKCDDTVVISTLDGNYSTITAEDVDGKTAGIWTIEHQSVDNTMICGGIDSGDYTFVIARYPKDYDGDLNRIVGYISPRGFNDESEPQPGFWYALDYHSRPG